MDAVLAEDRGAARGHPHSGQRVAVNLVLLDDPLAFFMLKHQQPSAGFRCIGHFLSTAARRIYHVDAAVLSVVDLVVPYDWAAVGSDLDSRQGVPIDVITLYQTPPISKYVHPSLVSIEYSISPGCTDQRLLV